MHIPGRRGAVGSLLLVLAVMFGRASSVANIDTLEPIIRVSPDVSSNEDWFGYSIALHQLQDSTVLAGDFEATLRETRIVVGAPRGTFPGGLDLTTTEIPINRTGLVYQCPVRNGTCWGIGVNASDDSRRLFDDEDNALADFGTAVGEDKANQLMGATLMSSGEIFVACAPLYVRESQAMGGDDRLPQGMCVLGQRNLTTWSQLRPCSGGSSVSQLDFSSCLAGTAAAIYSSADTDMDPGTTEIILGAPGFNASKGVLFYYPPNGDEAGRRFGAQRTIIDGSLSGDFEDNLYQGFAVTTGYLLATNRLSIVTSLPRYSVDTFVGRVQVYENLATIEIIEDMEAFGNQTGEYFGWSLATADLNNDGYDEVIVGAPIYNNREKSIIEQGAVYIFENVMGSSGRELSSNFIRLEGTQFGGTQDIPQGSRFGSSVANIGDVNDDGFEDIAIGAPYIKGSSASVSGQVFIYYGSGTELISREPQQIITADTVVERSALLPGNQALSELKTFGYSMTSGVDVDANGFFDIAIGAYNSKTLALFRVLSVARISASVSFMCNGIPCSEIEVNLKNCAFNSVPTTCFDMVINASYTGRGLDGRNLDTILQAVEYTQDTVDSNKRLFFNGNESAPVAPKSRVYKAPIRFPGTGVPKLSVVRAYLENADDIFDELTVFRLDFSFAAIDRELQTTPDGITDFRTIPIIRTSGAVFGELNISTNCDPICYSDLELRLHEIILQDSSGNSIPVEIENGNPLLIVDQVAQGLITLNYSNNADDAIFSQIFFSLPSTIRFLSLVDQPRGVECIEMGNGSFSGGPSNYTCRLETPLRNTERRTLGVRWSIVEKLMGTEGSLDLDFSIGLFTPEMTVDFNNIENSTDLANNNVKVTLAVVARADLQVSSMYSPTERTYGQFPPSGDFMAQDLGDRFSLLLTVSNMGFFTVENSRLTIYYPGRVPGSNNSYYLYPFMFSTGDTRDVDVQCNTVEINPETLSRSLQRRKRALREPSVKDYLRSRFRRQEPIQSQNVKIGLELNCSDELSRSMCQQVVCNIKSFSPGAFTVILTGFVDQRFFANQADQLIGYKFSAFSSVQTLDGFVREVNSNNNDNSATLTVVPLVVPESGGIPWWIPVIVVAGTLLLLLLVVLVLIRFGFFRRRKFKKPEGEGTGPTVAPVPAGEEGGASTPEKEADLLPEKPVEGAGEGEEGAVEKEKLDDEVGGDEAGDVDKVEMEPEETEL